MNERLDDRLAEELGNGGEGGEGGEGSSGSGPLIDRYGRVIVDLSWVDPDRPEVKDVIEYENNQGLTVWCSTVAMQGTPRGFWVCSPTQEGAASWERAARLWTPTTRKQREEQAREQQLLRDEIEAELQEAISGPWRARLRAAAREGEGRRGAGPRGCHPGPAKRSSGMPRNWTRIDACEHRWERTAPDRVQCQAGCRTVLVGEMAAEPPVQGMDWSRAALVRADRLPPVPNPAAVAEMQAEP